MQSSWKWSFSSFSLRYTFSGFSIVYSWVWINRGSLCLEITTSCNTLLWFWAVSDPVIIDCFDSNFSIFWLVVPFSVIARVKISVSNSSSETNSVVIWSKKKYFRWKFSALIKNGSSSCSVRCFQIFSRKVDLKNFQKSWFSNRKNFFRNRE